MLKKSLKMGKFPQSMYTDTETDNTSSSNENLKKKRKPSILKYTSAAAAARKKKCRVHSVSEPDQSESRTRGLSQGRGKKLRGILKHTGQDRDREEKERYYSSSEDDDEPDFRSPLPPDKFLVGRVPLPPGSKPGRGGGVALIVRKSVKTEKKSRHVITAKNTITPFLSPVSLEAGFRLHSMEPKQTSSSSKKSSRKKRVSRKRSF